MDLLFRFGLILFHFLNLALGPAAEAGVESGEHFEAVEFVRVHAALLVEEGLFGVEGFLEGGEGPVGLLGFEEEAAVFDQEFGVGGVAAEGLLGSPEGLFEGGGVGGIFFEAGAAGFGEAAVVFVGVRIIR